MWSLLSHNGFQIKSKKQTKQKQRQNKSKQKALSFNVCMFIVLYDIIILGLPHQISRKKRTFLFPPKNQAPFSQ